MFDLFGESFSTLIGKINLTVDHIYDLKPEVQIMALYV